MKNLSEIFSRNFVRRRANQCWNWRGCKLPDGYGLVSRSTYGEGLAHRAAWRLWRGQIPQGKLVCHKCNNPRCVNPNHLYIATNGQNIKDAWRDGLGANGNSRKKVCSNCGSDFSRNKYGRYCVECKKASNRKTARLRRVSAMSKEGSSK